MITAQIVERTTLTSVLVVTNVHTTPAWVSAQAHALTHEIAAALLLRYGPAGYDVTVTPTKHGAEVVVIEHDAGSGVATSMIVGALNEPRIRQRCAELRCSQRVTVPCARRLTVPAAAPAMARLVKRVEKISKKRAVVK